MSNIVSIAQVSAQKKTALINRYAKLHSQLAALKTELELCKVEAVELLGEGTHETTQAKIDINWVQRSGLDQAKAKGLLTVDQLAQCVKVSSFYDVRIKHKGA